MKKSEISKQETIDKLMAVLDEVPSLPEKLEVVANLFIRYGATEMLASQEIDNGVSSKELIAKTIEIHKTNRPTLGASLTMQGIVILEWLDRLKG